MAEKGALEGVTELSEKIAQVMFEIEKAKRDYNLARAAELKWDLAGVGGTPRGGQAAGGGALAEHWQGGGWREASAR